MEHDQADVFHTQSYYENEETYGDDYDYDGWYDYHQNDEEAWDYYMDESDGYWWYDDGGEWQDWNDWGDYTGQRMPNPIQQKNPQQLQQIKDNNNKMQPPRRLRSSTATRAKVVPSTMAASLVAANGIELQTAQWVPVEKEKEKAIHRLASRTTRAMASDGTTTRRAKARASPRASTALKEKEKARKDMANGMDGRHPHVVAWTLRRASLTLRRELRDPRSSTSPHRRRPRSLPSEGTLRVHQKAR